jgi:hypothetical protein
VARIIGMSHQHLARISTYEFGGEIGIQAIAYDNPMFNFVRN